MHSRKAAPKLHFSTLLNTLNRIKPVIGVQYHCRATAEVKSTRVRRSPWWAKTRAIANISMRSASLSVLFFPFRSVGYAALHYHPTRNLSENTGHFNHFEPEAD